MKTKRMNGVLSDDAWIWLRRNDGRIWRVRVYHPFTPHWNRRLHRGQACHEKIMTKGENMKSSKKSY